MEYEENDEICFRPHSKETEKERRLNGGMVTKADVAMAAQDHPFDFTPCPAVPGSHGFPKGHMYPVLC